MKPGIDPKVDYAFKKVFGSTTTLDVLTDLLEAALDLPSGSLTGVEILNPFSEKDWADDRLSILDVKARDATGRWFNVEMQMLPHVALCERILYYWASIYSRQLPEGSDYRQLRPTVSICFLAGRLFPDSATYRSRFALQERTTGELLTDHLDIHFVELPKFTLRAEEVATPFERWCYFLRHGESLDSERLPGPLDTPAIHRAMEVLLMMSQSEQERDRYENRLKWERDVRQVEYERATALAAVAALEQELERARDEARQERRKAAVEQIQFLSLMMKLSPPASAELEGLSLEDLSRRVDELKHRALQSRS